MCHERPVIDFDHPDITYLEVDFPHPQKEDSIIAKHTDKGRKMLAGLTASKQFSPSHTMLLDADDCVSKRLAELVKNNPDANGWFINRGYKYEEGSEYVYLKRNNFYRMCGSCNIIRYDLNNLPENPEYNRGYGYYKFYIDHQKVRQIMAEKEKPLKSVPFYAAIYILQTGENIYGKLESFSFSWINKKKINSSLKDEFGLFSIEDRH